MKDVAHTIRKWIAEGRPFGLARVLQTWGSSPRPVGSALLISESGEMTGSVSGGCVEGAVVKEALKIIGTGGAKILDYGVTDNDAWSVGLSCGGKIKVLLQDCSKPDTKKVLADLIIAIESNQPCVWITEIRETNVLDFIAASTALLPGNIASQLHDDARSSELIQADNASYFIHRFPARSLLLIIGAAHITADLVKFAKEFNFETVVIDPRGVFTDKTVFDEMPDRIVGSYPSEVLREFRLDANTYAVVLSHDPKIDDNALHVLLRSGVAYIGALGSRKTHEKRVARLKDAGFSDQEIARIESPVGIDIDAVGAKEIALSIMGSLIKTRNTRG